MSLFSRHADVLPPVVAVPDLEPDDDTPLLAADALALVGRELGWPVGHAWSHTGGTWRSTGDWWLADPGRFEQLRAVTEVCDLGPGRGIIAAVLHLEASRFLPDLSGLGSDGRRQAAQSAGLHAVVGVPVFDRDRVGLVLEFVIDRPVEATDALAEQLRRVAERVVLRPAAAVPGPRELAS